MSTVLPASGTQYLCLFNPNDPQRFVRVEIIAWIFKDEKTQPVPVTAFGPADAERQMPIAQHWPDGDGAAAYFLLPNGPFFTDPPIGRGGIKAHEQMANWLLAQQLPPAPPTPPAPPPPELIR